MGRLNGPCSLVFYNRQFHIFYQYSPYDMGSVLQPTHWGHVTSESLIDWTFRQPALIPMDHYDVDGCLPGSAVVQDSYFHTILYTGSVVSHNTTVQTQNVAMSADGVVFQKYLYNPIINKGPDGAVNFRHPKVWTLRNSWYMLIGSRRHENAQLLLYTSPDLFNWKLNGTVARSYGDMGYIWESPDFFEINGFQVLILSVQGIQSDGYRFRNLHQTGYVIGSFNYHGGKFEDLEVSTATFNELDYGHDFYAAKTMRAPDGRRLLVGWLGMWENNPGNSLEGRGSMLTVVREVRLDLEGRLLSVPARELVQLRVEILEDAWYNSGESFFAGTKSFELLVNSTSVLYDTAIILEWNGERQYTIAYSVDRGAVAVDRGGVDGLRRADWSPQSHIYWRIFVDTSGIEVFCGEGEVVFSSRIYPRTSMRVRVGGDAQLHITQYRLRRSMHLKKIINIL